MSPDVDLVLFVRLAYEIYSGGGPSMYLYCVVCYHVIAPLYVRSIVMSLHTVTVLMMIRNGNGLWALFTP